MQVMQRVHIKNHSVVTHGPSLRQGEALKPAAQSNRYDVAHSSHIKRDTHLALQAAIQARYSMQKMATTRKPKI
jgi:hypothetical protein